MGKALYRKYRSKSLSELVGQEHITDSLARAIESGNISHAYLFTGPRGVGKTSVARILAHTINDIPYESDDSTHLDIIEIDAASNRRIDEIRDLNAKVHIAPTSAKYKVYIVDEVHMLTKEAFNALLKTLEEPPAHVVFILATTEVHKLPETIVSRTQRYSFRPVEYQKVIDHLASIAKQENVIIENDALQLIAEHGDGSFRDSISLLDQVRHGADKVSRETVEQALGLAPSAAIETLVSAINSASVSEVAKVLEDLKSSGVQSLQVAKQLSEQLRAQLINGSAYNSSSLIRLLDSLSRLPTHPNPQTGLEILLYDAVIQPSHAQGKPMASVTTKPKVTTSPIATTPAPKQQPKQETAPKDSETKKPAPPIAKASSGGVADNWQLVLDALKSRHNTLYGVVRMAQPQQQDDTLILAFSFPFHQKRLKEAKNQQILVDIVKQVTDQSVSIEAIISEKPVIVDQQTQANEDIEAVSNIFGSVEIV